MVWLCSDGIYTAVAAPWPAGGGRPELAAVLWPWQDNSEVGIRATITRLSGLLQDIDPQLWYHLVHKNKVRDTNSPRVHGQCCCVEKRPGALGGSQWRQCYMLPTLLRNAIACAQVNPQFYAFRWITLLLTQVGFFSALPGPVVPPPRMRWVCMIHA